MVQEVHNIIMEKDFKVCPVCGYEDGFHSMFEREDERGGLSWKFICPDCHNIFDIGLKANIPN